MHLGHGRGLGFNPCSQLRGQRRQSHPATAIACPACFACDGVIRRRNRAVPCGDLSRSSAAPPARRAQRPREPGGPGCFRSGSSTAWNSLIPTSSISSMTLARSRSFGRSRRDARPRNAAACCSDQIRMSSSYQAAARPSDPPSHQIWCRPALPAQHRAQSSRCTRSMRSWRSCASIDSVAIGRASSRRRPIGSPVSSQ